MWIFKAFPRPARNSSGQIVRRRPCHFALCPQCWHLFGPLSHLDCKYCSNACAYRAQTTGRKTIRRTLPKARSAQSLLRYHVQAGNIKRPAACEACGATDRTIEGAHFDYNEPLRVRWLCRSCHVRWDKREPKNATVIVAGPGRQRRSMGTENTPAVLAGVSAKGQVKR